MTQQPEASSRMTPRRRLSNGLLKDLAYLVVFCMLTLYHFYSQNVSTEMTPLWTKNTGDTSFLPPTNNATTTVSIDSAEPSISLEDLTYTGSQECPDGLTYLPNHIVSRNTPDTRRIPKIIHLTSKSRCFTKNFLENIQLWQFPDHDLYIHDDEAVERLLSKHWDSFPHISIARQCLRSGAGKADIWRYLVLWEYGGIYTDIDNAPGKFWNSSTIQQDDDAFFVIEKLGVLSQYFMALTPKHPLMYFALHVSLHRLLELDHVGKQNIPVVTGPGALKVAFKYFMRTQKILDEKEKAEFKKYNENATRYGRVRAGKYFGVGGRSVTVVGTKTTGWQLVLRGSVEGKGEGYQRMGMRHFSSIAKKKFNESCLVHMYHIQHGGSDSLNFTNW